MTTRMLSLFIALFFICKTSYASPAFESETYRNLFVEMGLATEIQVQNKIQDAYQQLFYGDPDNHAVYFETGDDMAFIKAVDSNDIRSEGMSYGMMIAVMMNDQVVFDKLWKFSKEKMQHQSGGRQYYFSWQLNASSPFSPIDENSAPDGEEYYAMSLMFAANRWGNKAGIYNYSYEANLILNEMVNKAPNNLAVAMINPDADQIVFTPVASSEAFTDPSYHLPAFYELWAKWATQDNAYWVTVAETSRDFFTKAAHPVTGLYTDYSTFDGVPKTTSFNDKSHLSAFDQMRTIQNIAVDYAWFKDDDRAIDLANRILTFYQSQGNYVTVYTHDGQLTPDSTFRMEAHTAMNAVAALAADIPEADRFVEDLWNLNVPSGQWRYYNGLLYLLGMLHTSGNFKIYKPSNNSSAPMAIPQTLTTAHNNAIAITLNGTDPDGTIELYTIVSQPEHGSLSVNGANVTYTPDSGFAGNDAFTFSVTDNEGNTSTTATIAIEVANGDTGNILSCNVSENVWNNGYTASVTVTNVSNMTVSDWSVTLILATGESIAQHWNATINSVDGTVSASNISWNGVLSPGQSTQFGFNGTILGNASHVPVSCE